MEEEGKTVNPVKPGKPESSFEAVIWQWQSGPDPDPWAEKDATKWSWQDYSQNDCLIIEEAFSLKKEVADLGSYEIDLKKMLQVNKQFKNRIRRVRRQEKSRFMMEMSEPVTVTRDQKTMNRAFGTIQHFLEYIMKRTPKAYGLYQRLKDLSLDSPSPEFEDVVKEVIACIEIGAETREKVIKTRSGCQATTFLVEAKKVIDVIKMNSTILGDFLKAILRVYTMETFICYWLNELLRSEDWEEINVLTPFLVCLVYTFKRSEYIITYQEPQGFMNGLRGFVGKKKLLYLYRGAALAKEHLDLYKDEKVKYFSWNGVTSTSRERSVAMNFTRASLGKAQRLNEPKVGVFFEIETEFGSSEDCEGMIDVFQNSCSQYPDEKEVILAPGTVFRLQRTRLIEKDIYEVSLRVKRKFEKTKENIALLGTLQDQAISKDKAIIDELPSYQSFRLLEMLKGNKLIRELEVRNSEIEEHIMKEIESLRATTNVRRKDVKLRDNTVVVYSLDMLAHYYSAESLDDILKYNKIRFKESDLKVDGFELTTLSLSEKSFERFMETHSLKELSQKIASANKITNLDLAIKDVTDWHPREWADFFQCIRGCQGLQSLRFKVVGNHRMQKESLEMLCQTIQSSKTLNRLHLALGLANEGFDHLTKTLEANISIQNLALEVQFFNKMSDKGKYHFQVNLPPLPFLQHLSLNFGVGRISDEEFKCLKDDLCQLSSLQHLSLNFHWCDRISDKGLSHLKEVLISLKSLLHLSLDFPQCDKISDEGLEYLKSGLLSLPSLQHLSINFQLCVKILDEGLEHLRDGLRGLKSLRHLDLNFWKCNKISNEGLGHLKEGLRELTSLQHLSLDFSWCDKVSDEGLEHLKGGLRELTSLQHLSLSFEKCWRILNGGLSHLKSSLVSLLHLHHLSLNFAECGKISDEGLSHFKSGLLSLTSLQHLSLKLQNCREISDEGVNHLKESLKSLKSLQFFSLNFYGCNKLSDEALNHLKIGLLPLSSLKHFSLDICLCKKISPEGRKQLLGQLKFVHNVRIRDM